MSTKAYRIMVTNDDGIESPGLGVLAQHLASAGHDVFVAAPSTEASGSSAAIGGIMPTDTVITTTASLPDAPGVTAFAVEGPPGRCVLTAARGGFGALPDLVISGINPGANVGTFLQLHSGTLGAALTAAAQGINAMAVSLNGSKPTHWETAATIATRLVDYLATCEPRTALNLNLPDVELGQVKELRTGVVSETNSVRVVFNGTAPGVITMDFERLDAATRAADSDVSLIEEGHAVLTRVVPPADVAPQPFPANIVGLNATAG